MNRPSIFDPGIAAKAKGANKGKVVRSVEPPTVDETGMMRTSLYLPRAVHDKLREIAFTERCKVHDLFIEGIDQALSARGFPGCAELKESAKTS